MLSKQEILSYLSAHKKQFMKDFYVDKIGLIGSYARDEQDENSDVDLVIYFNSAANDIANLENIIWAISKIENSVKNISSAGKLLENEEKYDSVLIKIMNIGESANNISEELMGQFTS